MRHLWTVVGLVVLALVSSRVAAQEFVLTPTEVAPFQFGGQTYRMWASLKNTPENPTQWQFRYDPAFLPEADQDGRLITRKYPFDGKRGRHDPHGW